MFKRNTMYLFDPYWDEKSKTWNAYCSRSEFDFPAKSSYESLFFRMLVLPFNKLPITYKVHVKRFKKSKSYLFLIHLEKRRAFLKTKKPLLFFLWYFCFDFVWSTLSEHYTNFHITSQCTPLLKNNILYYETLRQGCKAIV